MEQYNKAKKRTDLKLHALEADVLNIREKSQILIDRHSALLKRQSDLTKEHGGSDISGSDMIMLNVGGTKMCVLRETLTLVKGSRLEVLFSGRWESKLLRDGEGNVFFDVDSRYFKKVIEYLYSVKVYN